MHRLTSEITSDGSIGLTPSILELNYDNPDHIHALSSVTHIENNYDYSYDFNGNMQTGPDFTNPDQIATRTLAFNADNMPAQVAHTSSGIVNFLYEGEGKRAKKEGPAGTTYYFSNEFEIINGVPTGYIFAGNLRIAKVTDANITYFHKDHLGSSTVMTDISGNLLETGGYLPYGIQRENPGIILSNYKFTDQELDTSTNLYNYDARLYDPVIGRFISPDSIVPRMFDPQSLNRYIYCRNNPLIYVDPNGHEEADHDSGISNGDEDSEDNEDSEDPEDIPTLPTVVVEAARIDDEKDMSQYGNEDGDLIDLKTGEVVEVTRAEIVSGKNLLGLAKKAKNAKQFLKMFKKMHKKAKKSWQNKTKDETQNMIKIKKGEEVAEQMQKTKEAETLIDAFEAVMTGKK